MKKKPILSLLMIFCTAFAMVSSIVQARSEAVLDLSSTLYVTANQLNGRATPRKTGFIEARFDYGDVLTATGEWSEDHHWIEVAGGETGTVWVYADYVSERKKSFIAKNTEYKTVKIRSRPFDGKITGYIRKGKNVEITRQVLGWGKCKKGWVELYYLEEIGDV